MKKSQYKGTPHPKKRRPLESITNKQDAAAVVSVKSCSDFSSPLKRLHGVHNSVARLLEKIDSLVTGIHKKKLSEKLSAEEINNFNRAMLNVEGTLQEWHTFFLQASRRVDAPESRRYQQQQQHVNNDNLIPITSTAEKKHLKKQGELSDSPLVSGGRDEHEQSRKVLHFTPQLSASKSKRQQQQQLSTPFSSLKKVRFGAQTPSSSTSNSKKVTFANTPQTITPTMTSPPRSVRLRRPSVSSSSSCMSTPSFLLRPAQSPASLEMAATPQAPAEIVSKYPKWFSRMSTGTQSDKSPGLSVSPPKTCTLLRPVGSSGDQECHSPIALPPLSPFRTPGLMLRSPSVGESPVSDPGTGDVTSKLACMSL